MLWTCKIFDFLTPHELYAILQLRNEVFVVEQKCIFQDADNKDQYCHHAMGMLNEKLIAYTRIAPAGLIYEYVSIGRVVTSPDIRGTGIGKKLMKYSIDQVYQLYGKIPIKIGAQLYLKDFYQSFGFLQCSEVYLEDGIEHIKMMMNI